MLQEALDGNQYVKKRGLRRANAGQGFAHAESNVGTELSHSQAIFSQRSNTGQAAD